MEIHPSDVSDRLSGAVQYWSGSDSVGAVCVFPGYSILMVGLYAAADVCFRDFLYDRQLQLRGAVPVPSESGVSFYPVFSKDRDRSDDTDGMVSSADGGGCGGCIADRLLDV